MFYQPSILLASLITSDMDKEIQKKIIDKISSSTNILLVAHQKLDPDLCGSVLAFYHILMKLGKKPTVLCYEKVPPILDFLPNLHIVFLFFQENIL